LNKVIKDGKVGVVISPGYGAGWYTWNKEHLEMIFDPMVVDLIEKDDLEKLRSYAILRWPEAYIGGLEDLKVYWLPEGTEFRIHEYDGNESIEIKEELDWIVA
jgi:hypothetical protein